MVGKMMTKEELLKEIARLESLNDIWATELHAFDSLMKQVGFSSGIETVKQTALALQKEMKEKGPLF